MKIGTSVRTKATGDTGFVFDEMSALLRGVISKGSVKVGQEAQMFVFEFTQALQQKTLLIEPADILLSFDGGLVVPIPFIQ